MLKKIAVGILMAVMLLGASFTYVEAQNFTLPQLVELFINLGIIAPEKAAAARAAVSSSANSTGDASTSVNAPAVHVIGAPSIQKHSRSNGEISTSTVTAMFNLKLSANNGDYTFMTPSSNGGSVKFSILSNGSKVYPDVASVAAYSIPSSGVVTAGLPVGQFRLEKGNSVTIPVTYIFEDRQKNGSLVPTGSYAVAVDSVSYYLSNGGAGGTSISGETKTQTVYIEGGPAIPPTVANTYHSADTDKDWKISDSELNEFTTLYNYRSGSVRTGDYYISKWTSAASMTSGYVYIAGTGSHDGPTHSGDTNKDWKISLSELSRVIALKNAGGYKIQSGTEDGYAPVPKTSGTSVKVNTPVGGATYSAGDMVLVSVTGTNVGETYKLHIRGKAYEKSLGTFVGSSGNAGAVVVFPSDVDSANNHHNIIVTSSSGVESHSGNFSINSRVQAGISVYCSASPYNESLKIGWAATASGGTGSLSYSWSAYNDVTAYTGGSTQTSSFTAAYGSAGTKQAYVTVKDSNGKSASASCSGNLVKAASVTGSITVTPSSSSVSSGSSVNLSYTTHSNAVTAKLYMYCPAGVNAMRGSSGINDCNTWYTFPMIPSGSTYTFNNTSSQSQNVSINFYEYTSDNPNYAVGVSTSVTVQGVTSAATCTDSDGGVNINVAGLTDGRVNGIGSYFNDSSVGTNGGACSGTSCTGVAEGYCSNGAVTNYVYQCPSGYSENGACATKTVVVPPVVNITTPTFSTTSWYSDDSSSWPTVSTPSSLNSNQAIRVKTANGTQYLELGRGVNSGKLTSSPAAGTTQVIVYVYDYAQNTYATSERTVSVSVTSKPIVGGPAATCTDSDGGVNINVAGLTDGRVNGIGSYFNDSSVGSNGGACSGTSCTGVAEGYCSNGAVTNYVYQCPSGYSENGACATKPVTVVSAPNLSTTSWYVDDSSTWPTVSTASSLTSNQAIRVKGTNGAQYFEAPRGTTSGRLTSSPAAGTSQLLLYIYDYAQNTYLVNERAVNVNVTTVPQLEPEPEPYQEPEEYQDSGSGDETYEEQAFRGQSQTANVLFGIEEVINLIKAFR